MTIVTLVYGGSSTARENVIASRWIPGRRTAAIIEGLAGAHASQDGLASLANLTLVRIAPGCPCCTGKLTMRVTLNRVLRENPEQLYLSLANGEHLTSVINFLQEDQYRERLEIGKPIDCSISGTDFADTGY